MRPASVRVYRSANLENPRAPRRSWNDYASRINFCKWYTPVENKFSSGGGMRLNDTGGRVDEETAGLKPRPSRCFCASSLMRLLLPSDLPFLQQLNDFFWVRIELLFVVRHTEPVRFPFVDTGEGVGRLDLH